MVSLAAGRTGLSSARLKSKRRTTSAMITPGVLNGQLNDKTTMQARESLLYNTYARIVNLSQMGLFSDYTQVQKN